MISQIDFFLVEWLLLLHIMIWENSKDDKRKMFYGWKMHTTFVNVFIRNMKLN
jgi:hypothetical protein